MTTEERQNELLFFLKMFSTSPLSTEDLFNHLLAATWPTGRYTVPVVSVQHFRLDSVVYFKGKSVTSAKLLCDGVVCFCDCEEILKIRDTTVSLLTGASMLNKEEEGLRNEFPRSLVREGTCG